MRLFERSVSPSKSCSWGIRMRFELLHRCALTLGFAAVGFLFLHPPGVHAQGGEPQYFAIRGAKVVTVSGPPIEGATIVVSRGIITAVARDRKSTRLNSSHVAISYAVFCLKKKKRY